MYDLSVSFRRELPVEIQEKVIDQLHHDTWSLRSCALTCRAWHVRSRFHLLQDVHVGGLEQLDEFCSYLRDHEPLRLIVQSIVLESSAPYDAPVLPVCDLVCTPLLDQLPKLRRCKLREEERARRVRPIAFHPSILTYLKTHSYIETLCLSDLLFSSPTPLVALVTALPLLKELICDNVIIMRAAQNSLQAVQFGPAYHRKPTKLRSLVVRNEYMGDSQAVLPIAGGTVEYLVLDLMFMPDPFSSLSLTILQAALARVSALDILVYLFKRADVDDRQPKAIKCIEWVLPAFVPGALQNLRIVFHGSSYRLQRLLQHPANTVVLGSLQQTILGLSPKSVTFTAATTKHNTRSLLTGLLEQSFPVLYERGLAKTVFPEVNVSHESSVHTVLVSPDGQWVASADDDSVILWRTEDGSVVKNWDVPFIRGLMFTSESRHLVICSRGRLLLWNMQPPFDLATEVPLEHEAKTCVWSPDGTLCALSGQQNWHDVFRIRIYRTGTLEARSAHQLTLPHRDTNSCGSTTPAFSHDSRRLLFTQSLTDSTDDGSEESESITWIWDVDSTAPPRKLMNHGPPVVVSTFNTVDSTQVRLTLDDGTVQVRDVASGTVLISLGGGEEAGTLSWPLCSSDGRLVATGSSRDGIGRLCNIETGAVLWARGAEGPHDTTRVSSRWLSFSPDGTRILSTSSDAAAKLWDTHTGRPVLSLTAHINSVEAASFSPDGRRIAAGYEDGTVRLWNTEDGACLAVFTEHVVPVTRLAFSLDGEIMCSAARDGTVQIRRLRGMLEH